MLNLLKHASMVLYMKYSEDKTCILPRGNCLSRVHFDYVYIRIRLDAQIRSRIQMMFHADRTDSDPVRLLFEMLLDTRDLIINI